MMNKILHCDCGKMFADVAPLVLRVALGVIFAWHGYDKIFNTGLEGVAGFLGSIGIPLPGIMVYVLAYGELVFGLFLVVGFLTHWSAKYAVIVALVAFFLVHMQNGFAVSNGGYEFIMLIFAAAVSVMITGAGKYSVDAMWKKKKQSDAVVM